MAQLRGRQRAAACKMNGTPHPPCVIGHSHKERLASILQKAKGITKSLFALLESCPVYSGRMQRFPFLLQCC